MMILAAQLPCLSPVVVFQHPSNKGLWSRLFTAQRCCGEAASAEGLTTLQRGDSTAFAFLSQQKDLKEPERCSSGGSLVKPRYLLSIFTFPWDVLGWSDKKQMAGQVLVRLNNPRFHSMFTWTLQINRKTGFSSRLYCSQCGWYTEEVQANFYLGNSETEKQHQSEKSRVLHHKK